MTRHIFKTKIETDGTLTVYVDKNMGITGVPASMGREVVSGAECAHFERCPMRRGDGSCFCWQAERMGA